MGGEISPWQKRDHENQLIAFECRLCASLNKRSADHWAFNKFYLPDPTSSDHILRVVVRVERIEPKEAGKALRELEEGKPKRRKRISLKK